MKIEFKEIEVQGEVYSLFPAKNYFIKISGQEQDIELELDKDIYSKLKKIYDKSFYVSSEQVEAINNFRKQIKQNMEELNKDSDDAAKKLSAEVDRLKLNSAFEVEGELYISDNLIQEKLGGKDLSSFFNNISANMVLLFQEHKDNDDTLIIEKIAKSLENYVNFEQQVRNSNAFYIFVSGIHSYIKNIEQPSMSDHKSSNSLESDIVRLDFKPNEQIQTEVPDYVQGKLTFDIDLSSIEFDGEKRFILDNGIGGKILPLNDKNKFYLILSGLDKKFGLDLENSGPYLIFCGKYIEDIKERLVHLYTSNESDPGNIYGNLDSNNTELLKSEDIDGLKYINNNVGACTDYYTTPDRDLSNVIRDDKLDEDYFRKNK